MYRTHGDPFSDPPRAVVCIRCGAVVADEAAHTEWHDQQQFTPTISAAEPIKEMRLVYDRPDGLHVELSSPDIRCYESMVRLFEAVAKS